MQAVERALRALEPIMASRVRAWRQTLDACDRELRRLLEQEILNTAQTQFGDFRSKVLLSLPPQRTAFGEIKLGKILYDAEKWTFGLSRTEITQNLAIFGRSGAGKTNVAFLLLSQLSRKGIPWIFLDWKRTARHLVPQLSGRVNLYTPGRSLSPFPFNPFQPPPGLETSTYSNHVVDALGDAYGLGDAARSVLHKVLTTLYASGDSAPALSDVRRELDALPDKERMRGWKATAHRALDALGAFDLGTSTSTQTRQVTALLGGQTILELDGLSPSNKKFFVPILSLWLFHAKLPEPAREQLGLTVFVEEAHHVFFQGSGYRESLMNQLLRQCREVGIGIVVIDQHPSQVSAAVLGNTYTSICLNLKDPKDISKAAGISGLSSSERHHFAFLPTGRAIVKLQDRWRRPFLVQFPLVTVPKGSISDADLRRALSHGSGVSALSKSNQSPFHDRGHYPRALRHDGVLGPNERSILDDILLYPDDGVDARYKRLGLSTYRGHRSVQQLLKAGILEESRVQIGSTRRRVLRHNQSLTRGLRDRTGGPGESIAHEFWKRQAARELLAAGYRVRLEAPRAIGRTDVAGTSTTWRIAIEVETGRSDVLHNVRQNLLSGFDRIIVLATTRVARRVSERRLAEAGLLSARVKVLTAGIDSLTVTIPPGRGPDINHGPKR